jgi:predicted ATPase/DNA-binding CsgD family transcriptional regulator
MADLVGQQFGNLPSQLTPLIGREQEVAAVCTLLHRPHVRLVTLTGAGGIGKTRLGLQVATELRDMFPDGVYFVNLAPIRDPSLLISTIAHDLDIPEAGTQSLLEAVKASLRDKQLLLLLDNFEQIITAGSLLDDLLGACYKLSILVTSREVLHLQAEYLFPVPPLVLPDLAQLPEREELAQYEAVALFMQRARTILPGFQLTPENSQAIAEICVRLDGLPLAIELAAARVNLLPPQALLTRLEHRLQVLTRGARDMPARQQALRNTLAWSYHLLEAQEQQLFRGISVFFGGCTLEAVESVVRAIDNVADDLALNVLNSVASLIDKSLLQQTATEGEESRLVMLETIHEFGLECLRESGEAEVVQRAHALYYLALLEQAEPQLQGTQQLVWLTRLEQEMANVFEALEAAYAYGMDAELVRGVNIFARFLETRGLYEQAEVHLERAQQAASSLQDRAGLATTLCFRGELAEKHGQYAQAEAYLQQGLELARQVRDRARICDILRLLGVVASRRGNYVQEGEYLEEGLALARQLNHHERISGYLRSLGVLANNTGNYSLAEVYFQEGLALARQAQDVPSISVMLSNLGHVARFLKHYEQAAAYLQEGLVLARQSGHRQHESVLLATLGELAIEQRNDAQAETYLREGLAIARQIGHAWFISALLNVWGEWYLQQNQFDAASITFEEALEQAPEGSRESIADALYGLARVALAQGKNERAFRHGQESLAIFEASGHYKAAEVRQWLNSGPDSASRVRQPMTNEKISRTYPDGLTAREVEILRLIAQGMTDAQVAEQLVISPRTVNWHLTSIYSKIQVTSRSAATRYAIEHQLV